MQIRPDIQELPLDMSPDDPNFKAKLIEAFLQLQEKTNEFESRLEVLERIILN
jgi:hypothetical protein